MENVFYMYDSGYPASHTIIEVYQIGQALFSLCESVLTTTNNPLSLHVLRDVIQNELFHHSADIRDIVFLCTGLFCVFV